MSNPLLRAFSAVVLSLAMTTGAAGAKAPVESHPCATVTDPAKRLACFDAAFRPAAEARSAAVDPESERRKALREFGLNKVQLRAREPEHMRKTAPDRIEAKVERVSYRPTGERMVALDSGQVWLLTEATSKGHLRQGDQVVIRTAALGTYMLVTPGRVSLRARRIQ